MKALILGYGSIGKRHCEVLEALPQIDEICLVTSQDIVGKTCYKSLEEVSNLNKFDYFVIATPTFLHLQNLKFLSVNLFIFSLLQLFLDLNLATNLI